MARHQIKTKLHIESFAEPVSGQTRKGLAGGEGAWAAWRHNKHRTFFGVSVVFYSPNGPVKPLLPLSREIASFLASYKHRKREIVSLWEKVK